LTAPVSASAVVPGVLPRRQLPGHRSACRHLLPVPGPVHNERVTGRIGYPFEPKSIARLQAGQFWAVPLSDGRHACGRVLHVPGNADGLYLNSRVFLAGHMDWSGSGPPTSEDIAGCGILAQGRMHVAAIRDTGSPIIGAAIRHLSQAVSSGDGQYRDYSLAYHNPERVLPCLRIIKRQIKNPPAQKLK